MLHNFFGHDESDTASTLKKLCKGTEAFYALFEFQPNPAGADMYTKQHISADGLVYLMNGQSINEEILSRSAFTNALLGRRLHWAIASQDTVHLPASVLILASTTVGSSIQKETTKKRRVKGRRAAVFSVQKKQRRQGTRESTAPTVD
jgi:hypothetical protein